MLALAIDKLTGIGLLALWLTDGVLPSTCIIGGLGLSINIANWINYHHRIGLYTR
jgi:hypothetical protein